MSDQSNGVAVNGQKQAEGRDGGGRFAVGNKGGPGNPFARKTAALRKAIQDAVTPEDMAGIALVLRLRAQGGNLAAARLLFSYAAGRPGPGADPDTLDAHELAVRRGAVATPEDMKALFESLPAVLLNAIASAVSARVQKQMEAAFAEGVKRQEEMDRKGQEAAPEQPGPYPGHKADWAPDWLEEGLPGELARVFEACPAWAPDTLAPDGARRSYAKMLRSVREGLLDRLADRPECVGRGRTVPPADGKRGKR